MTFLLVMVVVLLSSGQGCRMVESWEKKGKGWEGWVRGRSLRLEETERQEREG